MQVSNYPYEYVRCVGMFTSQKFDKIAAMIEN